MVISFEPLPKEFFAKGAPVPRLTTFRERWRLLEAGATDLFCVLPFNEALRRLRATGIGADAGGGRNPPPGHRP